MNAKRQTIWLVSMLSLMVVLSAYYLFTEDVDKLNMTANGTQGDEVKVSTQETTSQSNADKQASGKAAQDAAKSTDAKAQTGTAGKTDEQVLQQLASQSAATGADYIIQEQIKRNDELSKQADKWMTIANDSKKSNDEVTQALEELSKLEELQSKVMNVEELLMKDYKNAIVTQDSNKWKVIVQADKLEKSQAVSIVDLVMKEMTLTQDQITVQYMK